MTVPEHGLQTAHPAIHFTPLRNWVNDPHGICWVDGKYHLFYQHNPAGKEWAPRIVWGHATSSDLLHWHHQPVALAPYEGEAGCWSGSVLLEDGRPTIFYTSALPGDPGRGRIAIARPDDQLQHWLSGPDDVVVAHPPENLGVHSFRDPCLLAVDGGWAMIVGAGVDSGDGLALQYLSADGRNWRYDGVLCARAAEEQGLWTGNVWECPQLFRLGSDWVLVVSAWDDHRLLYCVAAVGSYDGHVFTPESWSRLSHDTISYAMTSFADHDDRPCVMFWLREDPADDPADKPWAGAQSLPMIASINADRTVRLDPHPNLTDSHQLPAVTDRRLTGDLTIADTAGGLDVELTAEAGQHAELHLRTSSGSVLSAVVDGAGEVVKVTRAGGSTTVVPRNGPRIRVVVDTGLLAMFTGNGCATFRYPGDRPADLYLTGSADRLQVHRLRTPDDEPPDRTAGDTRDGGSPALTGPARV